ncbi:flavin reductase family protein [Actinopolymorpha alba]|uniref:flavin reductase family protein n=1 Tax=Actinopolymorpha alba TaxID=533267 RepID=UPI00036119C4|nr:flavin reductase family protein [Actinopolymorpha alba]
MTISVASTAHIQTTSATEGFRSAFRRHAAGVVVITADAGNGPAGFTATSLASVSLDPPLLAFALSTTASSWPVVAAADTVVVNFLSVDQHPIARRFATSGIDRFAAPLRWSRLQSGEPVLDEVPCHLVAAIEHRQPTGDHALVVARVVKVTLHRDYPPLAYHSGSYAGIQPI